MEDQFESNELEHCESAKLALNNADILTEILAFLNPVQIVKSRQVCNFWSQIIARESLWKKLCEYHHLFLDTQNIKSSNPPGGRNATFTQLKDAIKGAIVVEEFENQRNPETFTFSEYAELSCYYKEDWNCYLVTQAEKYLNSVLAHSNSHLIADFGMAYSRYYISFLVSKLVEDNRKVNSNQPRILFLLPGSGLISEITYELKRFLSKTGLKSDIFFGQTSMQRNLEVLAKNGVDIMVATPARAFELLRRVKLDVSKMQYVVIEDERTLTEDFRDNVEKIFKVLPKENLRVLILANNITQNILSFSNRYMKQQPIISLKLQDNNQEPFFEISGQFGSYKELFHNQKMASYTRPPVINYYHYPWSGTICLLRTTNPPSKYISVGKLKCSNKEQLQTFADYCYNGPIHPNLAAIPRVRFIGDENGSLMNENVSIMYENTSIDLMDLISLKPDIFTEQLMSDIIRQVASAFEWLEDNEYYLAPTLFNARKVRANVLKDNWVQIKLVEYLPCFYETKSTRVDHMKSFMNLVGNLLTKEVETQSVTDLSHSTTICGQLSHAASDFVNTLAHPNSAETLTFSDVMKHVWLSERD